MSTATMFQATQSLPVGERYGKRPGRRRARVTGSRQLARGIYQLTICDSIVAGRAQPGQFVNLYSPNPTRLLPRPFGVAQVQGSEFDLIYQIVGQGTAEFARLQAGDWVNLLGPLGQPFQLDQPGDYLLVGGGLGVPPLIRAAQSLARRTDARVLALLGYREERFADDIVRPYANQLLSIDNAAGNVITLLDRLEDQEQLSHPQILSCGPKPMMQAIAAWAAQRSIPTQLSLEERMGCGYGACVACAVDSSRGRLKVCTDGPVFRAEELGWGRE
ncbi:dihydroorotate dehydrogenase [Bombiscardovia nodaiensis]|uniref:Dihydroorotate dehydrogenase n=1 Tax=Bombiscardovia nodaiensis TaxID=2932181 RepID=A0ABM8B876_9BIFI|nr:dihydroorotate dehydrogenase [Bombiscardovia nodaiensis]